MDFCCDNAPNTRWEFCEEGSDSTHLKSRNSGRPSTAARASAGVRPGRNRRKTAAGFHVGAASPIPDRRIIFSAKRVKFSAVSFVSRGSAGFVRRGLSRSQITLRHRERRKAPALRDAPDPGERTTRIGQDLPNFVRTCAPNAGNTKTPMISDGNFLYNSLDRRYLLAEARRKKQKILVFVCKRPKASDGGTKTLP